MRLIVKCHGYKYSRDSYITRGGVRLEKEVINVGLYGGKSIFGGRETPLEASVISCDRHSKCSFYQNGQCLNVRGLSGHCKYGSVNTIRGYTSRAKKYGEFKRKWQNHERYGKLQRPPTKLGLIDDVVVFPYPFVRIKQMENGTWKVTDPSFGSSIAFIDYEQFTVDLIYQICTFRPQALMGGEITKYQKETVPLFLAHLEEVIPERYQEFIEKHKEFAQKIDYVGRKAYLKTIKPSMVYYKSERYPRFNEEWYWDGEYLTYQKGYVKDFSITNDYEVEKIIIKPSDKSVVSISSNEQVSKETVFVD